VVRPVRLVGRTKDIHSSTSEDCRRDCPPQRNVDEKKSNGLCLTEHCFLQQHQPLCISALEGGSFT
jgi:hypothetical protein